MKMTENPQPFYQDRFKALDDLSNMMDHPEEDILKKAVETVVKATNSKIGYIYFVSENETRLSVQALSENKRPAPSIQHARQRFNVSEIGGWGSTFSQRKPVITNNIKNDTQKTNFPGGHIPAERHMTLPVFDRDTIVLMAGVGNKSSRYSEEDLLQLSFIMNGMWHMVKRKRLEKEVDGLKEKTIELQAANEELHYINTKQQQTEIAILKKESIFRGVFDNASVAILVTSQKGEISMANPLCEQLFGYTPSEILSKTMFDLIHPDEREAAQKNLDTHIHQGSSDWQKERKLVAKNGSVVWGNLNVRPLKLASHKIESIIVVVTDITARIIAEKALKKNSIELVKNREQLQIIMDNVPALISYVDKHLCYQFVNKNYENMFGMTTCGIVGKHVKDVIDQDTFKKVKHRYIAVLNGESQQFEMEYSRLNKNYILDVTYLPHQFGKSIDGIFILIMDITERKKMEEHLKLLSVTDPLTGATNRRFFMDSASSEIDRCQRYDKKLSFLMIDIDHFKAINDTHGHHAGDEVLKSLVKESRSILRNTDVFSRIGGEEFIAVLIETNLKSAEAMAERLRCALKQLCIRTLEDQICFTVSIGVTEFEPDDSLERIMKRCDLALYQAKNAGRDTIVCFNAAEHHRG